jgi:Mrp family chromosome partitioning ATPase
LLRAGKRVTVVEGDLRRPALHRYFKITNSRGITNVVSGATPLADALQVLTFKDASAGVTTATAGGAAKTSPAGRGDLTLRVLPSGPVPPNPGEIVNSQQLADILETLKADADYVLVDAPPMFAVGDTAAMADKVDGIIVILRLDETTADTIKSVEDFFRRVPTRALGLVVSGVPRESRGRYYRQREYYD